MKYLIKHHVINGDHIKQAVYEPAYNEQKSKCYIDLGCIQSESGWDVILKDIEADRFWEAYMSDAYSVVNP